MRKSETNRERKRNQAGVYLVSAVIYYVSEQQDQEKNSEKSFHTCSLSVEVREYLCC